LYQKQISGDNKGTSWNRKFSCPRIVFAHGKLEIQEVLAIERDHAQTAPDEDEELRAPLLVGLLPPQSGRLLK
jgi:hypothetical protein